ncbi:UbiA prenyltransferase family-domain-containing protein [Mycena rebaudengoi]|nr:UbiA prenyltransferase family-domain-containing protein [Mycena rebaudengoi]
MPYSSAASKETTLLITHHEPQKPATKFPLGLVSEPTKSYLELIRIDKPTGTILMFWPFAWGLTMAAYTTSLPLSIYVLSLAKALVGAFLLRSSACTINDIFDREMDAGVERTRNRPLASGRVSVLGATVFLIVQYALGVTFFYSTEHGLAFWVAIFQLGPLFAIYPLLKRVTHWPQAWLGFAMNFGFITSSVSTTDVLNYPLLSIAMAGCWWWTMLYDTIYACQDIRDDVKMGVRSTAILFGTWIRPLLKCCAVTFAAMLAGAGFMTVDLNVPTSCWLNFNRNGKLGWIVLCGLLVDYVLSLCILQSA